MSKNSYFYAANKLSQTALFFQTLFHNIYFCLSQLQNCLMSFEQLKICYVDVHCRLFEILFKYIYHKYFMRQLSITYPMICEKRVVLSKK